MEREKIGQDIDKIAQLNAAKSNINRGLRILAFALVRFFAEVWIVQEIWNGVAADKIGASHLSYWESLAIIFMIRIITGQFKIKFTADKNG